MPWNVIDDDSWRIIESDFTSEKSAIKWAKDYAKHHEVWVFVEKEGNTGRIITVDPSGKTKITLVNGSESYKKAKELAKSFHGRDNKEEEEIIEEEEFSSNLAVLGYLEKLEIVESEDSKEVIELEFEVFDSLEENEEDQENVVRVCQDPENETIILEGGDQEIDESILEELDLEDTGKNKILLGKIIAISYFSDKHHLEGPKSQADGEFYRHEFGEENGRLPSLVYDCRNQKLEIVGGDYKIKDVGIWN